MFYLKQKIDCLLDRQATIAVERFFETHLNCQTSSDASLDEMQPMMHVSARIRNYSLKASLKKKRMPSAEKGRRESKGEKEGRNHDGSKEEGERIYTQSCEMVSRARLPFDEIESRKKKPAGLRLHLRQSQLILRSALT